MSFFDCMWNQIGMRSHTWHTVLCLRMFLVCSLALGIFGLWLCDCWKEQDVFPGGNSLGKRVFASSVFLFSPEHTPRSSLGEQITAQLCPAHTFN